jgi:hypothetical protein
VADDAARPVQPAGESGGLLPSIVCVRHAHREEFRGGRLQPLESRFREEGPERRVLEQEGTLFNSEIASSVQSPNKTPEPTRVGAASYNSNPLSRVAHL